MHKALSKSLVTGQSSNCSFLCIQTNIWDGEWGLLHTNGALGTSCTHRQQNQRSEKSMTPYFMLKSGYMKGRLIVKIFPNLCPLLRIFFKNHEILVKMWPKGHFFYEIW